jgi:hypothetical protein
MREDFTVSAHVLIFAELFRLQELFGARPTHGS